MGELAQDKIDGFSCSWCGVYFEEEHGYSVLCDDCWEGELENQRRTGKIPHDHGLQKAIHREL